jgi:hypothetical protein
VHGFVKNWLARSGASTGAVVLKLPYWAEPPNVLPFVMLPNSQLHAVPVLVAEETSVQ